MNLDNILQEHAKPSDKTTEDKLLTLMDLYASRPNEYGDVLDLAWIKYQREHHNDKYFNTMQMYYKTVREL